MRQSRLYDSSMSVFAKEFLTPHSLLEGSFPMHDAERVALAAESLRWSGRLRLRVRGESMLPTLWPGDVVEIVRCAMSDVEAGDIVLAHHEGRFFVHRFLGRCRPEGFLLRGDSMTGPDPCFPSEALIGRLVGRAGWSHASGEDPFESADSNRTESVFGLSPWGRAAGLLLCYWTPARSLALKLHRRASGSIPWNFRNPVGKRPASMEIGPS